jgi:hypothetical protein
MGCRFLVFHICVNGDCFDLVCDAASPSADHCHLQGLSGSRLIKSLKVKAISFSETSRTAPNDSLSYTRRPESSKPIRLYDDLAFSIALWLCPEVLEHSQTENCLINVCVCVCARARLSLQRLNTLRTG